MANLKQAIEIKVINLRKEEAVGGDRQVLNVKIQL